MMPLQLDRCLATVLRCVLALSIVSLAHSPVAGQQAAPQVPTYATRQRVFAIPYSVDARTSQPVEVHLYVSTDAGAHWQLYARQKPGGRQFTFRAPGDGVYWFSSRTLDGHSLGADVGRVQAEMRIVVDTVSPQIDFQARPTAEGSVQLSWRAADPQLVAESIKIEYQEALGQPWQPNPLQQVAQSTAQSTEGSSVWWPQTAAATVNLRAEVRDRAGNVATGQRRLLLPQRVVRQKPEATTRVPWPSAPVPGMPDPGTPGSRGPVTPGPTTGPQTPAAFAADTPRPGGSVDTSRQPPAWPAVPGRESSPDSSAMPAVAMPVPDSRSPSARPAAHRSDGPPRVVNLPPGEQAQMTNTRRFQLDYDVDAVGPAGPAEVQLWATEDGGQSWRLWGTDADCQSPMDVDIERDGTYGFHVVVVSRNGLTGRKPRSGDVADIWVGVDTRAPGVELLSATYGSGDQAGKLLVRWRAEDQRLGPRPVKLLFGESAQGPWQVIAAALPNSGQYAWPSESSLPDAAYLRIEVRDAAGNVSTDQTDEPVRLDGLAPRARIRGIAPLQMDNREAFHRPIGR